MSITVEYISYLDWAAHCSYGQDILRLPGHVQYRIAKLMDGRTFTEGSGNDPDSFYLDLQMMSIDEFMEEYPEDALNSSADDAELEEYVTGKGFTFLGREGNTIWFIQ